MTANSFRRLLRSDVGRTIFGLVCVISIAWIYLLVGAGIEMEQIGMGEGRSMLMPPAWSASYAVLDFAMWTMMMVAMMLPSAASVFYPRQWQSAALPQGCCSSPPGWTSWRP